MHAVSLQIISDFAFAFISAIAFVRLNSNKTVLFMIEGGSIG